MRKIDLTGQQFKKLTAIRCVGIDVDANGKNQGFNWEVECECGTKMIARVSNLRSGNTTSCGCKKLESPPRFVHGYASASGKASEYATFHAARDRCINPKNPRFPRYGGRGIKFLFANFQEFIEHIGERPKGLVLDRMDNDGNYEVDNVWWVTKSQSIRNSSTCLGGRKNGVKSAS